MFLNTIIIFRIYNKTLFRITSRYCNSNLYLKTNILSSICTEKILFKHNELQYFLASTFQQNTVLCGAKVLAKSFAFLEYFLQSKMPVWACYVPSICISITLWLNFITVFLHSMLLKLEQDLSIWTNILGQACTNLGQDSLTSREPIRIYTIAKRATFGPASLLYPCI